MKSLRQKERRKSEAPEGLKPLNEAPEMVPASYIEGINGRYQFLPERPRFLTLSDRQVLDRANQPQAEPMSGWKIQAMKRCNESINLKPLHGDIKGLKSKYDIRL